MFRRRVRGAEAGELAPFPALPPPVPSAAQALAATRIIMAARLNPVAGDTVQLGEDGREGLFKWSNANLSTFVSADTTQGIYVPPASNTTGAAGAWVRSISGPINPEHFGIVASANDTDTSHAAANSIAWTAMGETLRLRGYIISTSYIGIEEIKFPRPRYYHFSTTVELNFGSVSLSGTSPSGYPLSIGTALRTPAGVTVLRVQGTDTSGATSGAVPLHASGAGSRISNLTVKGSYVASGVETEAHGIDLRCAATLERVVAIDCEGDGFHVWADTGQSVAGPYYGNANLFAIIDCTAERNRNGLSIAGADANAYRVVGGSYDNNRQWGIKGDNDDTSLGGKIDAAQFDSNGITGSGPPTVVTYSGRRAGVIVGQEVWCSTHSPTGTANDNQGWYDMGVGGVFPGIPAWVNGTTYRAGGSVMARSVNGAARFVDCYHEPGQGLPQVNSPNWIEGGILSLVRNVGTGGPLYHSGNLLTSASGFHTQGDLTGDGPTNSIGEKSGVSGADSSLELATSTSFGFIRGAKYNLGTFVRYNWELTQWDNQGCILSALHVQYRKVGSADFNTASISSYDSDVNHFTAVPVAAVSGAGLANGQMTFELTSNTQLKFFVKGNDGVVRSGAITLA